MSIKLSISAHTQTPRGMLPTLRNHVRQVLTQMQITQGSWSITLVDDATMSALHDRTMGLPTTTDVLTFDLRSEPPAVAKKSKIKNQNSKIPLDLDTVICLDQAARRALELGHPLHHELLLYAIHSLLHVCGHNDQTPAQARKMHQKEDAILTTMKIGPVFSKPSAPWPQRQNKSRAGAPLR